jgi:RNA-directed DNA polymerase
MSEFDQWMKHKMGIEYYARYTDDFVIVSSNTPYLNELLPKIEDFLKTHLQLELHPNKIGIVRLHRGIDFLGYVIRPYHIHVRTKTRRRIWKRLQ